MIMTNKQIINGVDRVRHFWKSLLSKETIETTKRLNTLV